MCWDIGRNLGSHVALPNSGDVGFNPEDRAGMTTNKDASVTGAGRFSYRVGVP